MPHAFTTPPKWSRSELKASRDHAEELFKTQRREEGPKAFAEVCAEIEPTVRGALAATGDLLALNGDPLRADPTMFQVLRSFCGPPISEEDLWTLVGGPKFKRVPAEYADDTAEVISLVIDPVRFPWVAENRSPSAAERDTAVLATTVLLGTRVLATNRRGSASVRQEAAVGAVLSQAGFTFDESRSEINVVDSLERGSYSKERKLAGAKCDVPMRMRDGRLLALECKVSNGPKNGWKRVNREVGGKAESWGTAFGTQIRTAVVLAGVFDVSCLEAGQEHGVTLFWEHDLEPLLEFVTAAH